jgi:hypothetical protein
MLAQGKGKPRFFTGALRSDPGRHYGKPPQNPGHHPQYGPGPVSIRGLEDYYSYGWVAEVIGSIDTVYQTFNVLTFGLSLLFLLLASFVLTTVQTLLRYFDLRLWQTEKGFRLNAGLLQKGSRPRPSPKSKLSVGPPIPQENFWFVYVRLFQASSQEVQRKQAITIPGCYGPQRTTIVQA